jgi:hypothetical protein
MKFGKRMNTSGVAGLLVLPLLLLLGLPPLAATAIGYVTRNLIVEYVTLSAIALIALGFYSLIITSQGHLLQRREIDILEAVREPTVD